MTKETKIGLLVGLAFIILFAIILSEKGAPQRDARSPNFATAVHRPADGASPSTPLQDGGRFPVENQLNPIVQPAQVATNSPLTEEPIVAANPVDEDALPPLPEAVMKSFVAEGDSAQPAPVTPRVNTVVDTSVAINSDDVGIPSHRETPGPSATPRGVFTPPAPAVVARSNPPVVPQDGIIDDRGLMAARTEPVVPTPDRSATVIPAVATNDAPSVIKTTHIVKEGDCVSKIAAEHYGRSTPDRVKLIETANKDLLKQKKGIRVGDKIKIPELAGYEDRFEAVAGFTQPRSTPPTRSVAPPADASIVSEGSTEVASATPRHDTTDRVEPFEIKDGIPRVPTAVPEIAKPTPGSSLVAVTPPSAKDRGTVSDGSLVKTDPPIRLSKTRWYEVQSGDTLSGIARRELGSERKFKAIYALNRDVLANKHALKPGTKLRLPPPEDPSLSSSITTGRMSPGTEP